jgi:hypothetical protein
MYSIVIWHNNAVEGTHNRVLMSAKTQAKVLRDFAKYLQRPSHFRSFNSKNLVQLWYDNAVICNIPAITEG